MKRRRFVPPAVGKLADPDAEKVRGNHAERIRELQGVPVVGGRLIESIELTAGKLTPIPHGLGRRAKLLLSPPRDCSRDIIVPAAAMYPTSVANWFTPNGTQDYWYYSAGANQLLHIPLPVSVGMHITGMSVQFYRGAANNPTITAYWTLTGGTASALTPTVAWTSPSASTTWETLTASYDEVVDRANWNIVVDVANANDAIRLAILTVEDAVVHEERSSNFDLSKYFVLRSTGDCTIDAWVY